MSWPRRLISAAAIALAAAGLDQASKWLMLEVVLNPPESIALTPFLNLRLGFNTGVSFGLFQEDSVSRSWTLIAVSVAVMIWLLIWLWRAEQRLVVVALGAILGGAAGNIIDRMRFGAVFDFLDFHAFGWHWPAFNIADSAIVIGVGLLLLDGFLPRRGSDDGR